MASTNRETVRDALAALLSAGLTGAGNPVQAVYGYLKSDFEGQSPVVLVQTGSIQRGTPTVTDDWDNLIRLNVLVWVMDADADSSWTDANVDDKCDEIEADIADIILANRTGNANWNEINYADEPTNIIRVTIGSTPYVVEAIPIDVQVLD